MTTLKERLFPEFASVSTVDWMAKITADLKGVPFEKRLVWKTGEGFDVNPFYRAEDIAELPTVTSLPGEYPFVRGTKRDNQWNVRQDLNVHDFEAANAQALDLLQKGVDALGFHFAGDAVNADNLATLLQGIRPEAVELNFRTCRTKTASLLGLLADYLKASGADVSACRGSVSYNPFKRPLKKGVPDDNWIVDAAAVLHAGRALPKYRTLSVDAHLFSNAGASLTQELGYALAWGNALINALSDEGFTVSEVAKNIKFNFGIGSNYFMEIAKFRAARWLWAQIVNAWKPACTCPGAGEDEQCICASMMHICAQTSTFNETVFDAHVNLLRTQTAAMSAAIAGVDSLRVAPFDEAFATPDAFSERIARNQQLLLKEECHFDKVVDPAAGSYYIETLTRSLADAAWTLFLDVEDRGGCYAAIRSGEIQQAVNATAASRRKAIATRREILLGTNQYPNFTETAAAKISADRAADVCPCGNSAEANIPTLNFARGAAEFEALRLATEHSGRTPNVFMLTIGNLAMRLARSQFSCNFFACAGYRVIDNLGFDTVEAGIEAALKADAHIVVLCSSDDEYAQYAPAAHQTLAGRAELVIAGAPACADDLRAQGITQFINVKSNVLETLKSFNERLLK